MNIEILNFENLSEPLQPKKRGFSLFMVLWPIGCRFGKPLRLPLWKGKI